MLGQRRKDAEILSLEMSEDHSSVLPGKDNEIYGTHQQKRWNRELSYFGKYLTREQKIEWYMWIV